MKLNNKMSSESKYMSRVGESFIFLIMVKAAKNRIVQLASIHPGLLIDRVKLIELHEIKEERLQCSFVKTSG